MQTLTLTDVATGWTECAPLLFREQRLLSEVLNALRPTLPFPLLGFDTDNDSVFMNETIKDWCDAARVTFTRSRPYRKNDQGHVEQKTGAVVRRTVGYRRYTGIAAATELARLYHCMRLFAQLDPVVLLHDIRQAQTRLTALADAAPFAESDGNPRVDVEAFLDGLRQAWKEGEIRPTSRKRPPIPRGRRRPDPLAKVTDDLKTWFDEDPSQTGRELLNKLQAAHPDSFPDGLIRTVQRCVKIWRAELARSLVFGDRADAHLLRTTDALCNMGASRVRGPQESPELGANESENTREQLVEATT